MPKIEVKKKKIEINVGASKIYPALTDLNVIPSAEQQVFTHDGEYGYDNVTVEGIQADELNIVPSKEMQNFEGLYNKVEVGAVTKEIDSSISEENIKKGVNILGVEGNFVGSKYAPRYISFYNYKGFELNEELANLDISNVTNMSSMFQNCGNLTSLDISNFNTSNVTNMYYMFYGCNKVASLNVSNFNTNKVTNMSSMFSGCSQLTLLDLSNFNTSNVTNMSSMFSSCNKLTSLDISNFNTDKVTDMSSMFNNCYNLTLLDLSNFNTSNVTNMNNMFYNCSQLTKLDIRNFTFTKVTYYSSIFNNIPADCLIIVKDDDAKTWVLARRSDLTNVKTVAELEEV